LQRLEDRLLGEDYRLDRPEIGSQHFIDSSTLVSSTCSQFVIQLLGKPSGSKSLGLELLFMSHSCHMKLAFDVSTPALL
jgi:hypothetical protein